MEELANKLFESREVAHNFHFNTKSYAKHMALQNYYENILPLADDLVEIYQGQYELIGDYTQIKETPILDDFILYFEGVIKYVKEARYTQLSKEDTHLQNIIDEIIALGYKTIYKLKYLK